MKSYYVFRRESGLPVSVCGVTVCRWERENGFHSYSPWSNKDGCIIRFLFPSTEMRSILYYVLCWLRSEERNEKLKQQGYYCFVIISSSHYLTVVTVVEQSRLFEFSFTKIFNFNIDCFDFCFSSFFQKHFPTVDVNGLFMFILGNLESFFWFALWFAFI